MIKKSLLLCVGIFFGFCFTTLQIQVSHAAIKCKDGYQVVKGQGLIGTPYCGDKWLSKLSGVPFKTIRNNPTERQRVCQIYGSDVKVQSICGVDADPIRPFR